MISLFDFVKRLTRYASVVFVFAVLFSSCRFYRDVEVNKVTEVRFTGFQNNGIEMEVYLEISNPNRYKVQLTDSDVDLFLEGAPVGKVHLLEPLVVPGKSISVQMMKINTSYNSLDALLGNVFSLMMKKEFDVEGKGFVTGKIMFVSRKVDVGFKETIDRKALGF